ncbi:MAG: 6,7-dimethyl-8-ribityllumazine synthase [Bacteroidetes bacterium]|nr:6,7-dimethyl-8-ribityllumazine synthase [Bacteroidota bacterium]
MASSQKNLSSFDSSSIPDAGKMRFGVVVSEWNTEITESLYNGVYETLISGGCKKENILRKNVPGSFELPAGALFFAEYEDVDAVICLGCVIQGETRHFEFICQAVSNGLISLSVKFGIPFIFGVLTTNNVKQAKERSGGKLGNKGIEAAVTAIKMVALQQEFENRK